MINKEIRSRLTHMTIVAEKALSKSQAGISGCKNACALLAKNKEGEYAVFDGCNIELSTSTVIHAERLALFGAISKGFTMPIAIVMAIKDDKVAPSCGYIAPMCGYCRQDYMYVNPNLKVYTLEENHKLHGYTLKDTLIKPYMSKGKIDHGN